MGEVDSCSQVMPQNRDESGRFKPGTSGNPGGRPKGLRGYILERTQQGEELVDFMIQVFRGDFSADLRMRAQAATWLTDRAFGRPATDYKSLANTAQAPAISLGDQDPLKILYERLEQIRERLTVE